MSSKRKARFSVGQKVQVVKAGEHPKLPKNWGSMKERKRKKKRIEVDDKFLEAMVLFAEACEMERERRGGRDPFRPRKRKKGGR